MTDSVDCLSRRNFVQGALSGAVLVTAPAATLASDSKNPAIKGLDGAVASFVEFLYAIA